MKKKIISSTLVLLGFILGASALSALAAWTAPSTGCTPPACNTESPLHVGVSEQSKLGPLILNTNTTNPIADIGLTLFGKLKIVDGNQADGKVLTSDAAGVGTWRAAPGTDSTAFCNSAFAATNTSAVLDLKKNGVNICKDTGGCVIKVTEVNSGWVMNGTSVHIVGGGQIIKFIQFPNSKSFRDPSNVAQNSLANWWGGGVNGDGIPVNIYSGTSAGIADDSAIEDDSANQISLAASSWSSIQAEVCDF